MKQLGVTFLLIGIVLISYCSYSWIKERNTITSISSNRMEEQKHLYNKQASIQKGEEIAKLLIPSIHKSYPVFLGTEPGILKKGAGLYNSKWTTLPSIKGHTVISGHRDTVFRDLRFVKEGSTLEVLFQGQLFKYQVKKIWVTDKDDHTVIVKKEEPTLTLTTCYPFFYVGNAPKRYIIQASLQEHNSFNH
jgi:sortase A